MWQVLTLAILLALMIGLEDFNLVPLEDYLGDEPPFTPKSLAATGFIILAAFTTGELFKRFKIPALLGYIAAGIIFGPQLIQIIYDFMRDFAPELTASIYGNRAPRALFSEKVIEDLYLINVLTVGVIGTMGGGELKISDIKESWKLILMTISLMIVTAIPLTVGVVMAIPYLPVELASFLTGEPTPSRLGAALLFGILAMAMSPAATLAIIQETRARGKFTSLTLGIVVVADLVLVALFLVGFNISKLLVAPDGFSFSKLAEALPGIGLEFGWAFVIGACTGTIFILYMRYVRKEMMLFTIGIIFAASFLSKVLHAETLLAFLTAGFIVQNFSKHGHDLIHELEKISTPVFIVYFMIQAAKLDIMGVVAYLPLTLLLAALRAGAYYGSARIATRKLGMSETTQSWLWLAFLSRGGVDLVLAEMVAGATAASGALLFTWGTDFQTVVVGTVVVHIIVGPPMLKVALGKANETEDARKERLEQTSSENTELDDALPGAQEGISEFPMPDLESRPLNQRLLALREHLITLHEEHIQTPLETRRSRLEDSFMHTRKDIRETLDKLEGILANRERYEDNASLVRAITTLYMQSRRKLQPSIMLWEQLNPLAIKPADAKALLHEIQSVERFDSEYVVEMEEHLYQAPLTRRKTHRFFRKLRSLQRTLMGSLRRNVPLGKLWRYYIELSVPRNLERAASSSAQSHGFFWFELGRYLHRFDSIFTMVLAELQQPERDTPTLLTTKEQSSAREERVEASTATDDEPSAPVEKEHGEDGVPKLTAEQEHNQEAMRELALPINANHDTHADDAEDGAASHGGEEHAEQQGEEERDRYRLEGLLEELDGGTTDRRERALLFLQAAKTRHVANGEHVLVQLRTWLDDAIQGYSWSLQKAYGCFLDAVARAGTLELPGPAYRPSRRFDDARAAETQLHERLEHERETIAAYVGWIVLDHQLALFTNWFGHYQQRIVEAHTSFFEEKYRRQLRTMAKRSQDALARLKNDEDDFRPNWTEWYRKEIFPTLRSVQRALDRELTLVLQGVTSRRLIDALEYRVASFSESIRLLQQDPYDTPPSSQRAETLTIQVRRWFSTRLVSELSLRYIEFNERNQRIVRRNLVGLENLQQLLTEPIEAASRHASLDEISDVASTNLPSAPFTPPPEELDLPEQSKADIEARLELVVQTLQQLMDSLSQDLETLEAWMIEQTSALIQHTGKPFTTHRIEEIERNLARYVGSTQRFQANGPVGRVLAPSLNWIDQQYRKMAPLYQEFAEDFQHLLSDEPQSPRRHQIRERLLDPSKVSHDQSGRPLPAVYRRLFNPVPLDLPEFYVDRPRLEQECLKAIADWGTGERHTVLITGERGIGKRTFIHNIVPIKVYDLSPAFQQTPIETISLPEDVSSEEDLCRAFSVLFDAPVLSFEALAQALRERRKRGKRQIVIVENAIKSYWRTHQGVELCRQFMSLLHSTSQHILWIVLMDTPAVTLLDTMIDLEDYFTHVFEVEPFTEDEIEEMVMNRHRISGFDMTFETPELRLFQKAKHPFATSEMRRNPRREFFKKLHGLSRGNPLQSLLLWMRAASLDREQDTCIHVMPLPERALPLLDSMTLQKKLILATLMQHSALNLELLARILDMERATLQSELGHLERIGLLEHIEGATHRIYRVRDVAIVDLGDELRHTNLI